MKLRETLNVWLKTVARPMGNFRSSNIRSENSLNQHYKLKHEEIWQKLKLTCPELGEIKDGDEVDESSSSSSRYKFLS